MDGAYAIGCLNIQAQVKYSAEKRQSRANFVVNPQTNRFRVRHAVL